MRVRLYSLILFVAVVALGHFESAQAVAGRTQTRVTSQASPQGVGRPMIGLGQVVMMEKSNKGESFETRQALSVRGGYQWLRTAVYVEYATFEESSGSGFIAVDRRHEEMSVWIRERLAPWRVSPFLAFGVGAQKENVVTRFDDARERASGEPQLLMSVAAGVAARIYHGLHLQIEGRLAASNGYQPSPLPGLGALLYYRF